MAKCDRKIRYAPYKSAETALASLRARVLFTTMRIYGCRKHSCYHLGHSKGTTNTRIMREELELMKKVGGKVMNKVLLINKNSYQGEKNHKLLRNKLISSGFVQDVMVLSESQSYIEYTGKEVQQAIKDLIKQHGFKTKMETPSPKREFNGVHTHCGIFAEQLYAKEHEKDCDECERLMNPRHVTTIAADEVTLATRKANQFNAHSPVTTTVEASVSEVSSAYKKYTNKDKQVALEKLVLNNYKYKITAQVLDMPESTLRSWFDVGIRPEHNSVTVEAESIVNGTPQYSIDELNSKVEYHTDELERYMKLLEQAKEREKRQKEEREDLVKTRNEIVALKKQQIEYEKLRQLSEQAMDALIAKIDDKLELRDSIKEDI